VRGQWLYVISLCAIARQWPDPSIAQVTLMLLLAAGGACLASRCEEGGSGVMRQAQDARVSCRKDPLRMQGFGAVGWRILRFIPNQHTHSQLVHCLFARPKHASRLSIYLPTFELRIANGQRDISLHAR
jgi:hypothetical protein